MHIKEVRKELGISNSWIANIFGYANVKSYNKSAGKKNIERIIVEVYKKCEIKSADEMQVLLNKDFSEFQRGWDAAEKELSKQ